MGLETVIIKQVVNVAKNTAKIQDAISVMQEKLANDALKVVEISQINTNMLAFDIVSLAKGEIDDPNSILTSDNLCSIPALTEIQKQAAQKAIDSLKVKLSSIINNIDALKQGLITVQQPLQTLEVTAENLDNIITAVKTAIKVIKLIPIPTSVPPGVGIPINVLTILSDSLDLLDKLIGAAKGITKSVPPLIASILGMITETIILVDTLVQKIPSILVLLSFLQSKIDLGDSCPLIPQEEIDTVKGQVSSDLQDEIANLGDSSIPEINAFNEDQLLNQLAPNSNDPLIYKGFTLTIEFNPENTFNFPSRRIRGERYFSTSSSARTLFYQTGIGPNQQGNQPLRGPIIIYNDPQDLDRYSFSSSAEVLVEEEKYKIDQFLLGLRELVNKFNVINQTQNDLVVGNIDRNISGGPLTLNNNNIQGTGSNNILPPYTISGSNIVTTSNDEVQGTITTTVRNVEVVMDTFGGGGGNNSNFTRTLLTIDPPVGSRLSREKIALQYQNIESLPIVLNLTGTYTYRMRMTDFGQDAGNQSNFAIKSPSLP